MSSLPELPISRAHPARLIHVRFRGEALVLGPTLMTDAEAIVEGIEASLPELRRFMPWSHLPQTVQGQLERLRGVEADYFAGRELTMGLFRERPGARRELLAMVGLHPRVPLNPRSLEVGYWAPTPHAKKGFTTFGVKCALVYAFDKLGSDRVQVMTDEANAGSRRVIEKCGFAFEGLLRNMTAAPSAALVAGGYVATGRNPMYALFPDTFAALPWVAEVRASMRWVNLAGYEVL
jgi:RimJ/RimL family protein N-acetyltransferase